MTQPAQNLAIAIPTYKRTKLLQRLLEDISTQTMQPKAVIVIDGDSDSADVLRMLNSAKLPSIRQIFYLPSNHPNAPYQRYLGWRIASQLDCDIILYFDDDLHLKYKDGIAKVVAPFSWENSDVMGVTATIETGDLSRLSGTEALRDTQSRPPSTLVRLFGSSANVPPGGLSPVGHRRLPIHDEQIDYATVQWLWGRVMAYRMSAIDQTRFSQDAFAMAHIKCGLAGDDTVLSRDICSNGRMLTAYRTGIMHPDDDAPKAYPYRAQKLAFAIAYNRRLVNDVYRSPQSPTVSDRLALLKNYIGVTGLSWLRAIVSPRAYRFAYAWGYTLGAIRGLTQAPTARNLTPSINWWADAEKALTQMYAVHSK